MAVSLLSCPSCFCGYRRRLRLLPKIPGRSQECAGAVAKDIVVRTIGLVDAPDATRFAWYTNVGEIRYYRDASTRLELPVEPWQSGWLAVVVRDEFGGANWQTFHLRSQ